MKARYWLLGFVGLLIFNVALTGVVDSINHDAVPFVWLWCLISGFFFGFKGSEAYDDKGF